MNGSFEIREFIENGRSPFWEWLDDLDEVTAARVEKYILRLEHGNFGVAKFLSDGVLNCVWISGRVIACILGAKAVLSSFCLAAAANDGRTPTLPQPWNDGSDTNKRKNDYNSTP